MEEAVAAEATASDSSVYQTSASRQEKAWRLFQILIRQRTGLEMTPDGFTPENEVIDLENYFAQ